LNQIDSHGIIIIIIIHETMDVIAPDL